MVLLPEQILQKNSSNDPERLWYQQSLRITQTVLREPDGEDYDIASLIDYLDATHSNVLVVNAGGIVDFFQNPLPAANINPFIGKRDLLREIVDACHAKNIKVIARVDFRGVEKHIFDQFSDWFARNADGSPQILNYTQPPLYAGCYSGTYRNAHALDFVDHVMAEYDVDGIWHNSIAVYGICYCTPCGEGYGEATGLELPVEGKSSDVELATYMKWKSKIAEHHMDLMRGIVKKHGEDKAYVAEVFGMFDPVWPINSGIDIYNAGGRFDFLVSVAFLRPNSSRFIYEPLGYSDSIIRFLRALDKDKEAVILWGGNGTAHRYVQEAPVDTRVWLWQAVAAGGNLWNCNFTGQNPEVTLDRRNALIGSDAAEFLMKNEVILRDQTPTGKIAIYYSNLTRQKLTLLADQDRESFGKSVMGVEQVLRQNHRQYCYIPDRAISAELLDRFELIILPNVALMTDAEAALFEDYVKKGGKLLATFETGLYDEWAKRRSTPALNSVFGISEVLEKIDTHKDCYQKIQLRHELMAGFEKTDLLASSGETLLVKPLVGTGTRIICSYLPKVHNQPPEKAWMETLNSQYATVIDNAYGTGRAVYFALPVDRFVLSGDNGDFYRMLTNAISAFSPEPLLRTNAPESVQITLTEGEDGSGIKILSLINKTSAQGRPLQSLVPVHDLWVEIMPENRVFAGYEVMRKEGSVSVELTPTQSVRISVEVLYEFTSVALLMGKTM